MISMNAEKGLIMTKYGMLISLLVVMNISWEDIFARNNYSVTCDPGIGYLS